MIVKDIKRFLLNTLRGRLILGVAIVHAVMMTIFIVDLTGRQRDLLLDRQTDEAASLSQSLSTSAAVWIASDDISGLQEIVESQRNYPELLFAVLTDERGRVLAHTDKTKQGLFLLDLPRDSRQTTFNRTPRLVDVAVPAMLGDRHVGWARVGIGQKTAGKKLAEITFNGALYALGAIVIGSFIAWRMGLLITRRLYAVQETISKVRTGERAARSAITGEDEAASIANEFNVLLDTLDMQHEALAASETKYRLLLRNIRAAVIVYGPDSRILMSNPLAHELLGLSEEQLLGKAAIDPAWHLVREDGSIMPPSEYPASRTLAANGPLKNLIIGIRRPDQNETLWILVNTESTLNEQGAIREVIITFVDITRRKEAEHTLKRLNRELRAISNCNQALVRAEDEKALLNEICRIVCDEAGYRMAWVGYAENGESRPVKPMAWAGVEDGYLAAAGITWADVELGRGPTGIAIRSGKTDCIQDFAIDRKAAPWRNEALQRGYSSSIALPLKDESKKTFGALTIYSLEPNAFTPNEMRILEDLASDLAFGITVVHSRIQRRKAEDALREQERYAQSLLRLSRRLERAETYEEVLNAARDEVRTIIGYQNLWAYLITADRQYARALFAGGPIADVLEKGTANLTIRGDRMLEEIAEAKDIVIVEDARIDERTDKKIVALLGNRTIVNIPIFLTDKHLGSVGTGTFGDEGVRVPTKSERDYLSTLASHMAVTLDRIQLLIRRKQTDEQLRTMNEELEQRVVQRTAELGKRNRELEQMNKAFVGRELKMVELKAKIKALEKHAEP